MQREKATLRAAGRNDLAEMVTHVAKVEGDGAGYDIKSYTLNGKQTFIERPWRKRFSLATRPDFIWPRMNRSRIGTIRWWFADERSRL